MPLNLFNINSNKRRLYLALFKRQPSDINPLPWHTGLVVMPKAPDGSIKDSRLFHLVDIVDGQEKRVVWSFDKPKQIYARTYSLAGLMLIGKVKKDVSDEYLFQILDRVPRLRYPEENPNWRCRHWVWAALPVLVNEGVVDDVTELPTPPQALWEALVALVQGYSGRQDYIACCDISGTEIDIGFNST